MGDIRILNWLDSILSTPANKRTPSCDRPSKRPRLGSHHHRSLTNKPKEGELRTLLPTPSTYGSSAMSSNRDRDSTASKRPRSPDNENARDSNQFHDDLTPRLLQRFTLPQHSDPEAGPDVDSRALSIASSSYLSSRASSKASKISRNSSPTKQLRNAELRQTRFARASFEYNEQPASLELLTQKLRVVEEGYAILPTGLQDALASDRVRPWMFGDKAQFQASDLPNPQNVRKIHRLARRCFKENLSESSWNNDVHSQVLEWVMRDSPGSDEILDYRCCLTAQIIPSYRPADAPSKMVDFCICIQPDASSPQHDTIQSLCVNRPAMSINHTDWGDLTKYPIAISIETKGPEQSYDTALLQVATWHSSQWRSLRWGRHDCSIEKIEFLPGIIVIKHDWYFVATSLDKHGKARTFERIPLGSSESIL
ncbi:hypothetical protein F66182_10985, partial [Fusarium sp. NRRL 66182]